MAIPSYSNWMKLYGPALQDALIDAYEQAMISVDPSIPKTQAHREAVTWARIHAGDLLDLKGELSLSYATRERVKALVAQAIGNGESLKQLQKNLNEDIIFDKSRAMTIARTETAAAYGRGSYKAALDSGRNMKRWTTQGDACDECLANESDGDIEIGEDFSGGVSTIPQHPNCECQCRYFHG